jgi:DNA polymerase delta subunit 1
VGQKLRRQGRTKHLGPYVISVTVEQKETVQNYHRGRKRPFARITLASPDLVSTCRNILEMGISLPSYGDRAFTTYESNVPFVLRFMIDSGMVGGGWVVVPKGSYRVCGGERDDQRTTLCQYEVHVSCGDLVCHPGEGDWADIAPLRILSFDIECAGRRGFFPDPAIDPVIQIANIVALQGNTTPVVKNVMVLHGCTPIVGADVRCYQTERDLLAAWAHFVRVTDPDILTGYNILNFDMWYLLARAEKLGVAQFDLLGRVKDHRSSVRESTFSSKAFGKRQSKEIRVTGRVYLDVIQFVQREHKLSSYTLNSVATRFLGEQKEDVHHSIITTLFEGTNDERRRLAVYCLKVCVRYPVLTV